MTTTLLPPGAPNACVKALDRLLSGKITQKEFDQEMVFFLLQPEVFRDIKPKPWPSQPSLFREYKRKTSLEKAKVSVDFWFRPDISSFLETRDRVKNSNRSNIETLRWMKTVMESSPDLMNKQKINERITDFEAYIYELP